MKVKIKNRSYQYTLVSTGGSSHKYGVCEVCKKHCAEVFYQIERVPYSGGYTKQGCTNLFGHQECLQNARRIDEGTTSLPRHDFDTGKTRV